MIKYLFLFSLFLSTQSIAQTNDQPVKLLHYALDSFRNGTVKLKSGIVYNQKLNYNIITKEMIFEQEGQYLAIAHPEEVDTVLITSRKFVPVGEAFYEYLDGTKYPVYIDHDCTIKEQGASVGFGTTNTGAVTTQKSLLKDVGVYKLKLPDQYEVVPKDNFYVRKNGEYHKIKTEAQLAKLFPDKKDAIKSWTKNHHTNFSNEQEFFALMQQIQ